MVSSELGSGTEDNAGLYDCIRKPVSRHKYTGFHCAVLRNADMTLVQSMLRAAPDLVAIEDSAGNDAVQLAVKYHCSEELVAEMVMQYLQAGCKLNGWHSILEDAEHRKYVAPVVSLVQEAALVQHTSAPSHQHAHPTTPLAAELGELATPRGATHSAPIAEQVTSVEQQAVHELASALDKRNRHAIDVASHENRAILEDASLYLKRFS